jgi:hypothetical protein
MSERLLPGYDIDMATDSIPTITNKAVAYIKEQVGYA